MISCEFDPGPRQELRVPDLIISMTLIIFHLSEGRLLEKRVVFSIRDWWEISEFMQENAPPNQHFGCFMERICPVNGKPTLVVPEMGASARFSYLRGVDVQVDRSYSTMHCENV